MTATSSASRTLQNRAVLGVLLMAGGLALYAISDALIKKTMTVYSVPQTTVLRAFTRLIPLCFAVLMQGSVKKVFATEHPGRHLVRLAVSLAYTYSFMYAFSITSLTKTYAIGFTSSFFMIFLSTLLLKEKTEKGKWLAVVVGMIGVLIAMRPSSGVFELGTLVILLGAFLGSLNKIFMRKLAATEHSLAIAIYPNLAIILVTLPYLWFAGWQPLDWPQWGIFGLIGIITATGQYAIAQSLRFAQGSTLAPIDYSTIVWVVLIDSFYWQKPPDFHTIWGAAIIICSNFYILYRSRKEQEKKAVLST